MHLQLEGSKRPSPEKHQTVAPHCGIRSCILGEVLCCANIGGATSLYNLDTVMQLVFAQHIDTNVDLYPFTSMPNTTGWSPPVLMLGQFYTRFR